MPRTATIHRKTNETDIRLNLNLDGRGKSRVSTGIRFFDHMLDLVARHGAFDLHIEAKGDLDVDQHHTVEDVGIALGEAVQKALGSKRGILRAGYFLMPMDETLAAAAIDLSGRPLLRRPRKNLRQARRRFPNRTHRRFLPRLRASRPRQRPSPRCSTAAPRITKSKPSSKPSPARYVSPSRATSAFARVLPSTKGLLMKITLLDYGAGKSPSSSAPSRRLGAEPHARTTHPNPFRSAEAIILPGVGHYRRANPRTRPLQSPRASPRRHAPRRSISSASASVCKLFTNQAKKRRNSPV